MWVWTDNFWKGRKRYAGKEVDFEDPKVKTYKGRLIAEGRIEEKRAFKKKEGDD